MTNSIPDIYPDDNPKTAIGVTKAPLHLVPPVLFHFTAEAFADGARKYGPYNWRDKTVSSSVYYGAILRHLSAWWDGENISDDAKVHHLGHAAACIAILLDAMTVSKLNDDRPTAGASGQLQKNYNKENNGRQGLSPNPVSTGDLQVALCEMEGRAKSTGDVGRDGGSLCDQCGYPESWDDFGFR